MCKEVFISNKGNKFLIEIDDSGEEITVLNEQGEKGSITLRLIEEEYPSNEHYHIINLSLDKFEGEGVGTRCLEFHKKCFGYPLTAGNGYKQKQSDGSHLTGAGVRFIEKMRKKGIVRCSLPNYD